MLKKKTHYRCKDTQTESEGMQNMLHANRNQKNAGVAITISDKIDFKINTVI